MTHTLAWHGWLFITMEVSTRSLSWASQTLKPWTEKPVCHVGWCGCEGQGCCYWMPLDEEIVRFANRVSTRSEPQRCRFFWFMSIFSILFKHDRFDPPFILCTPKAFCPQSFRRLSLSIHRAYLWWWRVVVRRIRMPETDPLRNFTPTIHWIH